MKSLLILLFFIGIYSCQEKVALIPIDQIKKDVAYLADDALEGRATGSEGARKAAAYIAERFKTLKLRPVGDSTTYFQHFTFTPKTNPHHIADTTARKVTGVNVMGYLDNKKETTVVLGAHYDHLGYGGNGSLYDQGSAIHNGADDNASGVAILMNLAGVLKGFSSHHNYLFIAFSGEELGLLGSNYLVKNMPPEVKEINYMINLDMVGRLNIEKKLVISGIGTSPVWSPILKEKNTDFQLVLKPSGVGPSDHTSFYLNAIPALHFFTGQHENYHKPSDDIQTLNYEGMASISTYIFDIISALDDKGKLAFTKTKDNTENVPRFKVTLGVMPDYMYEGEGLRIDGVTEDRPAANAGLQKGDVVLKMNHYDIKSMTDYMKALSIFEKGQTITVVIDRNGKTMNNKVTF